MSNNINYSTMLQEALKEDGFLFTATEKEKVTVLTFGIKVKSVPDVNYKLTVNPSGDTKLYSFLCTGIDECKRDRVIELMNELNCRFRYVTFDIDNDNDVCVSYDFGLYGTKEDVLKLATDAIGVCTQIIKEAFPKVMKIAWEETTDNSEFIGNDDMFSE